MRQDFVIRKLHIVPMAVHKPNGSFEMPWMESVSWVSAVNQFWFEDLGPIDWFGGGARIDAEIRARFSALRDDLKNNPPENEHLESDGLVAAVMVFDQFSRNLFRKFPEAYATDSLALTLARQVVDFTRAELANQVGAQPREDHSHVDQRLKRMQEAELWEQRWPIPPARQ